MNRPTYSNAHPAGLDPPFDQSRVAQPSTDAGDGVSLRQKKNLGEAVHCACFAPYCFGLGAGRADRRQRGGAV